MCKGILKILLILIYILPFENIGKNNKELL